MNKTLIGSIIAISILLPFNVLDAASTQDHKSINQVKTTNTSALNNNVILVSSVESSRDALLDDEQEFGPVTGFKMPRFVSLKSAPSNIRVGPGLRYPVQVVFKTRVPLQIIDEYKDWRKIKDWTNFTGWVHKLLLDGKRKVIVKKDIVNLYSKKNNSSIVKARLRENVTAYIKNCDGNWCNVYVDTIDRSGYLKQDEIWGTFPNEIIP